MHRKMTITVDEEDYEGLYRTIGKRRISPFIEDLARQPCSTRLSMMGSKAMAADEAPRRRGTRMVQRSCMRLAVGQCYRSRKMRDGAYHFDQAALG